MGAGLMDFQELSQQMDLHTGGMTASAMISDHHTLDNTYEQVSGSVLGTGLNQSILGKLGQYHGCWCHASLRRQVISNHGIG